MSTTDVTTESATDEARHAERRPEARGRRDPRRRSRPLEGSSTSDLGWRLDADFAFDNGFRVVQFTPPGSAASIQFGSKITTAAPGSARGLYLIVSDIQAARDALAGLGVEISEVFHPGAPGAQFAQDGADRVSGPAPDHATYGSFATFSDPDGNEWLLQEVTQRLPGRIDAAETAFASTADLANAMRRASVAHGEHEKRMAASTT